MHHNFTDIEENLIKITNKFALEYFEQGDHSSKYVTNQLKKAIGKYGLKEGYNVASSGFIDDYHSEWLYDMVWYIENSQSKQLETVELVLESEMSYGLKNIKFDFEKLLLSNSNHRIMICIAGKTPVEEIKNYFSNAVESYTNLNKGSRFLSLIWDDTTGEGDFIPNLTIK